MPWREVEAWPDAELQKWSKRCLAHSPITVIFANGVTDQSLPRAAHRAANFEFPRRIMTAFGNRPGLQFLTFGSVLESLHDSGSANAYFSSKAALAQFMRAASRQSTGASHTHLRLHTLYGGRFPHPHMFLGQTFRSLHGNEAFGMSSGLQFRQYHHADDIATCVLRLIDSQLQPDSVLSINGPETFRLRDIAEYIFKHFGKLELLKIGEISGSGTEVLEQPDYPLSAPWLLGDMRPALPGMVSWLEHCLRSAK